MGYTADFIISYEDFCMLIIRSDADVVDDDDVVAERQKIELNSADEVSQENSVVIAGLTKYFGDNTAVDNMHVAIPKGECFGLLGNY